MVEYSPKILASEEKAITKATRLLKYTFPSGKKRTKQKLEIEDFVFKCSADLYQI